METILKNTSYTAIINHKGAELVSLKNETTEFMWSGDQNFWGKHSPILFPIVGTLKNNSYQYKSKKYLLSRHGFARDLQFAITHKTENSATFLLKSSDATLQVYPFAFELFITYVLQNSTLIIVYQVLNNSDDVMPFSIGAHPAFALPNKFDNYSLAFDADKSPEYHILENDLITDKTAHLVLKDSQINLKYSLFENDALVFKNLFSKTISLLENGIPFLKISYNGFPDLGIWTKKDAPFLCIEPWFGYADSVTSDENILHKKGIQLLDNKSKFESSFSIELL